MELQIIQNKIYEIRGQKVMLDFDLAKIYGYSTKAFNQQVKNNSERFASDFAFKLTKEEVNNLRSKNLTSSYYTHYHLIENYIFQEIYLDYSLLPDLFLLVSTLYNFAKSESSITCFPLISYIIFSIFNSSFNSYIIRLLYLYSL